MAHVYIAAPWTHMREAAAFAAKLEHLGHDITEKWWMHREVESYPVIERKDLGELQLQAHRDLAGIDDCDAMIVLQLAKSEGKAFETGYAYNLERPICIVSPHEYGNLFHTLDEMTIVPTQEDAIKWLQSL